MKDIVLVGGARTAIGTFGGSLQQYDSYQLGALAIKGLLDQTGIDKELIDEVVMGCIGQYGPNAYLARYAAIAAGIPASSTALTVNRLCSSGLQAIITAALTVDHGDAEIAIGGGAESMSNYPYAVTNARRGLRLGHGVFEDGLLATLHDPMVDYHMGVTAENVAQKYGVSRADQDAFALLSQERALAAIAAGCFKDEIVPVTVKEKKSERVFDMDEHPRQTTMEKLSKLPPVFLENGTVTAGNSSGTNDAAAAVLVMKEQRARELGLTPSLRLVDWAVAGVEPSIMGIGPIYSTRKLLDKTGIGLADIGLIELNEAFAAQAVACVRELGLDPEKVNVNGSGISLGHPLGATGAILTIKLANEMRRRHVQFGLVSLCIGGGQGMSALFELI